MRDMLIVVGIVVIIIVPVFVFAQQTAEIASSLQSFRELAENLAKKVQETIPIVLASLQETDLTHDGFTGEGDWAMMASVWFTADATADINKDGVVNAIDFGLLNRNWNKKTE